MHVWLLSCFSHVWLFATLWTVACQAPLSIGFSRQEYWSGVPCTPLEDPPDPRIKTKPVFLCLLHWQMGSLPLAPSGKPKTWYTKICNANNNELFTCQSSFQYIFTIFSHDTALYVQITEGKTKIVCSLLTLCLCCHESNWDYKETMIRHERKSL